MASVCLLTDSNGFVGMSQSFDPFGSLLNQSGTASSSYGFAGEWADATGLQYLRARYYSPSQGRFMSKDPFSGLLGSPGSLHAYAYALNNPILFTDPSGEAIPLILIIAALGFAGGAIINTIDQYQSNGGWCNYDWMEMLTWGIGGAAAASMLAIIGVEVVGLVGLGLQGAAITLYTLGIPISTAGSLFGLGASITGLGATATTWLWTDKAVRRIAYQALQGLTNKANRILSNDHNLVKTVLTPLEYSAAQNDERVARMAFGNAIHRITTRSVGGNSIPSLFFDPVGGKGQPDFIGRGLFSGMNFDITTSTLCSVNEHLARPYGSGLIIPTYSRPPWFKVFP